MQINPDLPEAHQVRGWYDNQVDATTVFQTYSAQGGFENGGGKNEVFKTIAQIKEENIGAGEKVIYFVLSFFSLFFLKAGLFKYQRLYCLYQGPEYRVYSMSIRRM